MPIRYEVDNNGHFIHAIATGIVNRKELIKYEIDHVLDKRIKSPVSELFEIENDACKLLTKDDILKVIKKRKQVEREPTLHKCAIVLSYSDDHSWNLAKFYEGMVTLHGPGRVVVFGDCELAKKWLGVV